MKRFFGFLLVCVTLLALFACAQAPEGTLPTTIAPSTSLLPTTSKVPPSTTKPTKPTMVPTTAPTTVPTTVPAPEYPKAPDFEVYNQNGELVKLSDYTGKLVILNFWASWCGPCKAEMPDFQKAYLNYNDYIEFVMVNLTTSMYETRKKAEDFIVQQGYTFPVFFDTNGSAAEAYGIRSIPTTVLINEEGCILATFSGMLTAQQIHECVMTLLSSR